LRGLGEEATRSTRILKPIADIRGRDSIRASRETAKKPLMGSVSGVFSSREARRGRRAADGGAAFVPLAQRAAGHVAGADSEVVTLEGDGAEQVRQHLFIVLHVHVHDRDNRRGG
jgi:hypothetical protein